MTRLLVLVLVLVLALTALTGCYAPGIETSCTVQCGAGDRCPDDFVCRGNGLCGAPGDMCTGGPPGDARQDASTDGVSPDSSLCFGYSVAPFLTVCPSGPIPGARSFANTGIRTDVECTFMMAQPQPMAPPVCVIVATTIAISGVVIVRGPNPLVLLGTDRVTIQNNAVLDVASHAGAGAAPAGMPGPLCNAGNGGVSVTELSSGGGAGGAFGAGGGRGGPGGANGNAGSPQMIQPATYLRGGCPGGNGADVAGFTGGRGGGAGGAIYLMSGAGIVVEGSINASGAGAAAASQHTGGGGGGSGGMIILDAPTMIITGRLYALGGGGSSGGVIMGPGNPGNDPTDFGGYALESTPPPGLAGRGGAGGAPYAGFTGDSSGSGHGGGGGGGAGGVIRIRPPVPSLVGLANPPPT